MVAEPSVSCSDPHGMHAQIVPWAIAALVLYGVGIPLAFGIVLFKYRKEIREVGYCHFQCDSFR